MQADSGSDRTLERIRRMVRLYAEGPEYGITAVELINGVFLDLGQEGRVDLVEEVLRLLPQSAQGELRRVVDTIVQPGSSYVPFVFGVGPSEEYRQAWRRRMQAACQQLAVRFRQHLGRAQADPGTGQS